MLLDTDNHTLVPRLTPELERDIAELAYWTGDKGIALPLMLTARRMPTWIQPLVDRVLLISNPTHLTRVPALPASPPPSAPRGAHIQHLALSAKIERAQLHDVLRRLPNMHDLTIWTGDTYPELLAPLVGLTNLRRLSVNLHMLLPADAEADLPGGYAPFAHLTHLDLFGHFPTSLIPHLGSDSSPRSPTSP
ncbi:hypothetical protein HMN09_00861700 [Mycena chlorophos]|uniref:Uncharacterized protein n=1 Tax=Mycena chlorophos TaxID=658473 RepID=A0A8H6STT1_MYCCL|nr:hypothetical protein HMN09_00861700 [Mycena chlorophos]